MPLRSGGPSSVPDPSQAPEVRGGVVPPGVSTAMGRGRSSKPGAAVRRARRRLVSLRRAQHRTAGSIALTEEPGGIAENPERHADAEALASETVAVDAASVEPAASGAAKLQRAFLHPGKGQLIAAAILLLVGVAGVMQIKINTADATYSGARREDLIQLLDGLGAQSRRLESEIAELEQTRNSLKSGADSGRTARDAVRRQVQDLSILAGTVPAEGLGIRMHISDPAGKVNAEVLLDAVEELRDAGAEVIEINDTVRIVASSWFGQDGQGGLLIDGTSVTRPITIEAIGDPHALEEAAQFRGGIVSEIEGPRIGGHVQIEKPDPVAIDSLHATNENQYARPASAAPTPR
jgi:uncharacterized protein YlxW (UPF0749 family)